jgi:hypothetical protein
VNAATTEDVLRDVVQDVREHGEPIELRHLYVWCRCREYTRRQVEAAITRGVFRGELTVDDGKAGRMRVGYTGRYL